MEWLESLVLGLVQGVTEFLPVSSDGHLLLTQNVFAGLTGKPHTGKENLFFDVILHLGTTAAILVYYRAVIATGMRGLLGAVDVAAGFRRAEVVRVGLLAAIATSPLIPLALFFKKAIEATFEGITAAGFGFLVTASVLLLTALLSRRDGPKGPAEMTWLDALLIGLAQMFAPLPGVSRSGLTIAAALLLGLSRTWSVGFSLLIAVPAILGAAVWELRHLNPAELTRDHVAQAVAGTILAGVVGYFAILWLTRIVRSGRIWYFSVYLVVLALVVLTTVAFGRWPVSTKGNRSDLPPMRTASGKPPPSEITAEQAVRIAEEFIRANGYTDYSPEDVSNLDVDIPEQITEEDKKFLKEFLARRRNSIKPRAYGWRRGRRNDPKGWTVGFELMRTFNNDPSNGQAVEMDENGSDVWVEHMGFDLKSLANKL